MALSTVPQEEFRGPAFPFALASRTPRVIATAIAAFPLSACDGLLDFDCGVVSRTVANGVVRDPAGATLASRPTCPGSRASRRRSPTRRTSRAT